MQLPKPLKLDVIQAWNILGILRALWLRHIMLMPRTSLSPRKGHTDRGHTTGLQAACRIFTRCEFKDDKQRYQKQANLQDPWENMEAEIFLSSPTGLLNSGIPDTHFVPTHRLLMGTRLRLGLWGPASIFPPHPQISQMIFKHHQQILCQCSNYG